MELGLGLAGFRLSSLAWPGMIRAMGGLRAAVGKRGCCLPAVRGGGQVEEECPGRPCREGPAGFGFESDGVGVVVYGAGESVWQSGSWMGA